MNCIKLCLFFRSGSIASVLTGNWSMSSAENDNDNKGESGSTPGAKRKNRSNIVRQVNDWTTSNEAAANYNASYKFIK